MISASPEYLASLRTSHRADTRVRLRDADGADLGYLPLLGGSMTIDGRAKVRRRAQLQLGFDPWDPNGTPLEDETLAVQTSTVEIEHGILIGGGTWEWVKLATLRVESLEQQLRDGTVDATAYDRAMLLDEATLITPYQPAGTWVQVINDLVGGVVTGETVSVVGGSAAAGGPGEATVFQGNRLEAIGQMATAAGGVFANDPDGDWILDVGYGTGDPVWTFDSGDDGVLVDATVALSRSDQYNAIALRCEAPDADPILAFIVDADEESPTFWDGPFGRKPLEQRSDEITTEATAIAAATALLNRYKGATRSLALTAAYQPLLEPGDVIDVQIPGGALERHVVDAATLRFGRGTMTVQTRVVRT